MTKYYVGLIKYYTFEVEADNKEQAEEKVRKLGEVRELGNANHIIASAVEVA